ncbi:MAG: hypothetical protein WCL32_23575 [Planctomycetota bacterium]
MTGLWRELEKKLLSRQQPRVVVYDYYKEPIYESCGPPDNNYVYCIGIAKVAGKWRLCLGEYNEYDEETRGGTISWRPIADCSMEERAAAAKHVGKLEATIVETGETFLPKLDEAIRELEDRLADI